MRKIAARQIFTFAGPPLVNGVITLDEDGWVRSVEGEEANSKEGPVAEFYDGIVVPGFVNCHCHLELSHLLGQLPEKQGIGNFLDGINRKREAAAEVVIQAARNADRSMVQQGIAGVGDISNTEITTEIKQSSKIRYFTFIETFGFSPARAEKAIRLAQTIKERYDRAGLSSSIVPHAPYSVSDALWEKIRNLNLSDASVLSVHNQESLAEEQFFRTGGGPLGEHIRDNLGLDTSLWAPSQTGSLAAVLPKLPEGRPLLLVHNTFTSSDDLRLLKNWRKENLFLVLCPNSNLFIEDQLPPVDLFREEGMTLCLGTDSLASNHSLSLFSEVVTIHRYFPHIPLEELFRWACLNGALALGMTDRLGTISPGKNPGLVLISYVDFCHMTLTARSTALKIA